jgi:hypothetical protein
MIDALGNASADGEFDTYPIRLDRDSDDDGIGDIFEYGLMLVLLILRFT